MKTNPVTPAPSTEEEEKTLRDKGSASEATSSTQKGTFRPFVTPDSALDLGRLLNSLPSDAKNISCHDLKRIVENYNTIPCPNCYGGHQRPCQWCGDSGSVVFIPNENIEPRTSV